MTSVVKYALDADVLMQAARNYYAFDIAPGFWEALVQHAQSGSIISIDRVKAEIDQGNDQLKDWANKDFHHWFDSTNQDDVVEAYGKVMNWAYSQPQFMDAAKNEFAQQDNADPWLISYTVAYNENELSNKLFVVTQETFDPNVKRRIKIPNACRAFNIEHVDVFQMLRALGVKLG